MKKKRIIKPGPDLPKTGHIDAFAIIVDLNQFTLMVSEAQGEPIAQFISDTLDGSIQEIEAEGGEVVGFMGDAVLGIVLDGESAVTTCFGIAKDLDRKCEYISNSQDGSGDIWSFCPGGPSLKIAIEYGRIEISTIYSRLLGDQRLFIGNPINYAARISKAGKGNRCIIGPRAAQREFAAYNLVGPYKMEGKPGEPVYEYSFLNMNDLWIEGPRIPGKDTYWG